VTRDNHVGFVGQDRDREAKLFHCVREFSDLRLAVGARIPGIVFQICERPHFDVKQETGVRY
jgi:hypothetical protein